MKYKEKNKFSINENLFEIFEQAKTGIVISNPKEDDNPLIYVNKAFLETFEYNEEEVLGKNCRFLQKNDKTQLNLELVRESIKEEKEILTVLRNYTKSGKLIYNEVFISPVFDKKTKKLIYFLGIQKDISSTSYRTSFKNLSKDEISKKIYSSFEENTCINKEDLDSIIQELNIYQTELLAQNDELIRKDKKLQYLNEEFSSLFLDAPIPYILVDSNLQIKKYNNLADEYFKFTNSKIQIKSLFYFIKFDNIQKLIAWINNEDYKRFSLEIDIVLEFGNLRRYKLDAKEYVINNDLLMISLVDVQEEYEIKNNLEMKVQEEVNKRLKQENFLEKQAKLASMGEMIDVIAHQWLNPLTLIKLYIQNSSYTISEMKNKTKDLEEVFNDLEEMDKQVIHLVDTLNEFRSFFRPDGGSEFIPLKLLIDSVLILMKDELIKNKISVEIKCKSNFKIKVIENQFKHVLINLFANTRDAFIENDTKNRNISFELDEEKEFYIMKYIDNAGGIPKKDLKKVFELNFTTKSAGKGTGIGLYLCKQIVRKFNCHISANRLNDGTCFIIKFPK